MKLHITSCLTLLNPGLNLCSYILHDWGLTRAEVRQLQPIETLVRGWVKHSGSVSMESGLIFLMRLETAINTVNCVILSLHRLRKMFKIFWIHFKLCKVASNVRSDFNPKNRGLFWLKSLYELTERDSWDLYSSIKLFSGQY